MTISQSYRHELAIRNSDRKFKSHGGNHLYTVSSFLGTIYLKSILMPNMFMKTKFIKVSQLSEA